MSAEPRRRSWAARLVVGFGRFWWEFLVGDTPELFVGTVLSLGLLALLGRVAGWNAVAVVTFPVLVLAMLTGTVLRARRAASRD